MCIVVGWWWGVVDCEAGNIGGLMMVARPGEMRLIKESQIKNWYPTELEHPLHSCILDCCHFQYVTALEYDHKAHNFSQKEKILLCKNEKASGSDCLGMRLMSIIISSLPRLYLFLSCWARCPSPTGGLSRALARAAQDGGGLIRFNQILHMCVRQSPALFGQAYLMASNAPTVSSSSIPISYHLTRAS